MAINEDTLFDLVEGASKAIVTELGDMSIFDLSPEAQLALHRYLTRNIVSTIQVFLVGTVSGMHQGASVITDLLREGGQ